MDLNAPEPELLSFWLETNLIHHGNDLTQNFYSFFIANPQTQLY